MEAHEGIINTDPIRQPFAASAESDHSPAQHDGTAEHFLRERDSVDDFEHLDRDASPAKESTPEEATFGTPERLGGAGEGARALQAFLDTEREELTVEPAHLPAPLHPAPLHPAPAPTPAPAPAPPVPPHKESLYSDSREDLSDEEPEGPPTPAAPAPVPVPAPAAGPPAASRAPPAAARAPPAAAPSILQELGMDALFLHPERLHPRVEALVYWRCPLRSAVALGGGLLLLLALACCSLISVVSYLSLLALTGTFSYRLYRNIAQAVQKTSDGHPFKEQLEMDLSVSPERAQELAAWATAHLNESVNELRRLFLVEDLVDTLKFGVMLWCLTYVGACFNGMTLLIISYVGFFTVPKVYETNKVQIDANLEVVSAKFQEFTNKVRAAIPIGKKAESEKDK